MTSRSRITQTNICICSYSTIDRKDMCYVTNYTKTKFCKLYNIPYEFVVIEHTNKHAAWYKIDCILSLFDKYNAVYFIDDDAGFCNYSTNIFDLIDLNKDLVIAKINDVTNTGSFYLKKSDKSIAALKFASTLYEKYKNDPFYEQTALVKSFDKFKLDTQFVDDVIFNASVFNKTSDTIILHLMGILKNIVNREYLLKAFNISF